METYSRQIFPGLFDTTQSISKPKLLVPLLMATPVLLTTYFSNSFIVTTFSAQTPSSIGPMLNDVSLNLYARDLNDVERMVMWRALRSSSQLVSRARLVG